MMYGPFHRYQNAALNHAVLATGKLKGRRRRNIYAGAVPAVKAYPGPLPSGARGIEFMTAVAPHPFQAPEASWPEGHPGVEVIDPGEEVAIPVTIIKTED
jgi:hypothetical protein